jgi:site-specific DNA recombinase
MPTREACRREMLAAASCRAALLGVGGIVYRRIAWGAERIGQQGRSGLIGAPLARCPDCNVEPGGIHHLNCDREQCPCCGGQRLGCECGP